MISGLSKAQALLTDAARLLAYGGHPGPLGLLRNRLLGQHREIGQGEGQEQGAGGQ